MSHLMPELLSGIAPEQAAAILALGTRLVVSSGSELFHLGDPADCLFVLQRGRVRLTLPMNVRGRAQEVLVEERVPGQTVGWSALIPPYRFTLTATVPLETEVVTLSRDALRAFFAEQPATGQVVALNLAAVIGERLQLFQTMWLREMQRTVELSCA
jgi:CRP-like cAMP-binding protein